MRLGRRPRSKDEIEADIVQQLKTSYRVDQDGCWIWTGPYFASGYPRIARHRPDVQFSYRAHVASFQFHNGLIPKGIFVCHECVDKRGCINPKCLWLGTNKDNQLDAVSKGAFRKYWTTARRTAKSKLNSGEGNPMYGKTGKSAPAYGRTGKKHPMFGKHHSLEARKKISVSLLKTWSSRP